MAFLPNLDRGWLAQIWSGNGAGFRIGLGPGATVRVEWATGTPFAAVDASTGSADYIRAANLLRQFTHAITAGGATGYMVANIQTTVGGIVRRDYDVMMVDQSLTLNDTAVPLLYGGWREWRFPVT